MKKVVISDVDGVLNTGQFLYNESGKCFKVFGPHDADGVKLLKEAGWTVRFISADKRGFEITKKRIDDMNCELTLVSEKERLDWIESRYPIKDIVYVGDGYYDAQILRKAGCGISPKNARIEARTAANYVTDSKSGEGAFLDAAIIILKYYKDI